MNYPDRPSRLAVDSSWLDFSSTAKYCDKASGDSPALQASTACLARRSRNDQHSIHHPATAVTTVTAASAIANGKRSGRDVNAHAAEIPSTAAAKKAAVPGPGSENEEGAGAGTSDIPIPNSQSHKDPRPRALIDARCSAIYVRVSSEQQSVQPQLDRLRTSPAVGSVVEEYVDYGVSGSADSRPAFDRLRDDIRAGAVDVVVAGKLDRIGRSARSVLEFFDLCERHGVRVVLSDQAIDTATPTGRLLRTVMAAVAEFEGDLIRERTQQAMFAFKSGLRKTKTGRPVGRPRRLTPAIVQRIQELRARGLPWKTIAQHVGLPSGTCRKVGPAPRGENPRVGNPPPEFRTPAGDP